MMRQRTPVRESPQSSTSCDDSSSPGRSTRRISRTSSLAKKASGTLVVILVIGLLSYRIISNKEVGNDLSAVSSQLGTIGASTNSGTYPLKEGVEGPAKCTIEELMRVRMHLDPHACAATINRPFKQKCSLSKATKCPDTSNYLDEYYDELQKQFLKSSNRDEFGSFVGLSVGCNKGFDALNTLRMGTFDASLSKEAWKKEMLKDGELWESVCAQDATSPFSVDTGVDTPRKGVVHCFEPMPATFRKLKEASKDLGYDEKGYKVIHAAVDKESSKAYFQSSAKSGVENIGLEACKRKAKDCSVEVEVLTLSDYVKQNIPGKGPIHILQVDVEGYDNNVLQGAGKEVLQRVEYLEFEYNWMGPWKKYHLYDTIEMLDEIDFTCYWTGVQKLWRITGCWQVYFDIHAWSNISCANRRRVPGLASKMEGVFQQTLKAKSLGFRVPQLKFKANPEAMSLDPDVMTMKYLSATK